MDRQPPRRTQTARIGLVTAATLALALLLGYVGYRGLRSYTAGKDTTEHFLKLAPTPIALWATTTESGELANLVVFAANGNGVGGSMVALPAYTSIELDGAAVPYSKLLKDKGIAELADAVGGGTRMTFAYSAVSAPAEVAGVLGKVLPLEVNLPVAVTASDGAVLFPKGALTIDASNVASVWPAVGRSAAGARPNMNAILGALAAKVGGTPGPDKPAASPPADFAALAAQVLSGPVQAAAIPAVRRPAFATADFIDNVEAVSFFANRAPSSVSSLGGGGTYRIEAAPGSEELVKPLVGSLLFAGFDVTQIVYDGQAPAETEIAFHTDDEHKAGEIVDGVIGPMKVVPLAIGKWYEGIDVVVRVGKNATKPATPVTEPPSTTVSPESTDPADVPTDETVPGS